MRPSSIIISIFFLSSISCVSEKETVNNDSLEYYIENQLSFFNPYEITYAEGRFQGYTYETWIRQPDNLRMLHETFKKIGYSRLISEYDLTSNPNLLWGYVKRPINDIIDSLIITYPLDTIESKYYREFWLRREKEKNAEVVNEILHELSTILIKNNPVKIKEEMVNDTLFNLVIIDRLHPNPNRGQALKDFEYLKDIGMHGSAYNVLFENIRYQDLKWDKEELLKQLETDDKQCCPRTWILDNTK